MKEELSILSRGVTASSIDSALQNYGNCIAINSLELLRLKIENYAILHCSGDHIDIYDVESIIDKCILDLQCIN